MEYIYERFISKLSYITTDFKRSLLDEINWNARLIGIKGARGSGKTTLLLQYIKIRLSDRLDETLYISLDEIWLANNPLELLIDEFHKKGGKFLFLDEVHKYDQWSQIVKNSYDAYPNLKIVFTGSSALEIINARADLSRRAVVYNLQGLSFREYLSFENIYHHPPIEFTDIISSHLDISREITSHIKPLQYFDTYLESGYFPFYKELPSHYHHKVIEVINMILEIELPLLRGVETAYIHKLKELLGIISSSVPFIPNVSKLSAKMNINRNTLLTYLHYLDEVGLTKNLHKTAQGISRLQKPAKIYLENTNFMYSLGYASTNKGNIRETFFCNQLGFKEQLTYTNHGDFMVNDKYTIEVGASKKGKKQIENIPDSFIAADGIEIGFKEKIPLWLFGFMY